MLDFFSIDLKQRLAVALSNFSMCFKKNKSNWVLVNKSCRSYSNKTVQGQDRWLDECLDISFVAKCQGCHSLKNNFAWFEKDLILKTEDSSVLVFSCSGSCLGRKQLWSFDWNLHLVEDWFVIVVAPRACLENLPFNSWRLRQAP